MSGNPEQIEISKVYATQEKLTSFDKKFVNFSFLIHSKTIVSVLESADFLLTNLNIHYIINVI